MGQKLDMTLAQGNLANDQWEGFFEIQVIGRILEELHYFIQSNTVLHNKCLLLIFSETWVGKYTHASQNNVPWQALGFPI